MLVTAECVVNVDAPAEQLQSRLIAWTKAAESECVELGPPHWKYARGSWSGWLTADFDDYPTRVEIDVVSEEPLTVHARIQVNFGIRKSLARELEPEVGERMRHLASYLRGVYDF
jgi:hypothetical protein